MIDSFITHPHYTSEGVEKSHVRGYTHKLMVFTSPCWLYMTWSGNNWCQIFYYFLTSGSLLAMFTVSSIYHHFEHSKKNLQFWLRLDTCILALATFGNTVPALMHFKLYFNLVCYIIFAIATLLSICFWDPRRGIILGAGACVIFTAFSTLPEIVYQIDHMFAFSLLSHVSTILASLLLFIFPDNDAPQHGKRPIIASHDYIHLLTVSYAFTFMYYNYLVHTSHLCDG